MLIEEYSQIDPYEILSLYSSVGWTAYTDNPDSLLRGIRNSLLTLAAFDKDRLLGLIRCVGDGETIIYVQDILVYPEFQRRGIGSALARELLGRFPNVRQIVLSTDKEERTMEFYKSMGFESLENIGCRGFMLLK
ncbi:MAG: GNAT family N-acetyltransferase [Oscillospiraceae bacterium]|nr:GNAT family N-acetyltransferase [Oscillospiraceae bacterium]